MEERVEGQIVHEIRDLSTLNWTSERGFLATGGSKCKASAVVDGVRMYYKLSSFTQEEGITGHENFNEIVVDRLLDYLQYPHVSYRLIHAVIQMQGEEYDTYVCESRDMLGAKESKVSLASYYAAERMVGEDVYDFCRRMGWEEDICRMMLVDFLIFNQKRTGDNIEVIRDAEAGTYRLAPLYDHGTSLAYMCRDDMALHSYDVIKDRPVENFVGSTSLRQNVARMPAKYCKVLPPFDPALRRRLFEGMEDLVSEKWRTTVWHMLTERRQLYVNLCHPQG